MEPNFSVITKDEIITGMHQARNSKAQKKIYADMCCCSVEDIENILREEQMKNGYSAEENNLIISMVAEGKSNREIAEKLKRTYPAITQKIFELRSLGHIPPVNRNKYTMCAPSGYTLATEDKESLSGIASDEIPGEIEFYKEQLAVAEAALEKRTRELFIERQANAELRILARMIAKAVDV